MSACPRNAADVLATLQVMQDFGVNLICVEDGIDSSKDAGKLKVLSELDMEIFKSKNQFFIDAATYYIEHFGREALTEPKKKKEPQFISTEEMAVIEERIRQEAREEARQEANKEVMSMVGSMLAAMQATKKRRQHHKMTQ